MHGHGLLLHIRGLINIALIIAEKMWRTWLAITSMLLKVPSRPTPSWIRNAGGIFPFWTRMRSSTVTSMIRIKVPHLFVETAHPHTVQALKYFIHSLNYKVCIYADLSQFCLWYYKKIEHSCEKGSVKSKRIVLCLLFYLAMLWYRLGA